MSYKATEVIGLPIYSKLEAKKIDSVTDLIYDPSQQKIVALLVDTGGWFSSSKIILLDDIESIGENAVVILSSEKIRKASEVPPRIAHIAEGRTYLENDEVITEEGTKLGTVKDLMFEMPGGQVVDYEISQGVVENVRTGTKRLSIKEILRIGKEAIVVRSNAQSIIEKQSHEQGAQKTLEEAQSKAGEFLEIGKYKIQELTDQGKQKIEQATQSIASNEQVQSVKQNVTDDTKRQEAVNNAKQGWETVKEKTGNIANQVQEKTKQVSDSITSMVTSKRKENASGKKVGKDIFAPNGDKLASAGDVITPPLLEDAENVGVLNQILNNIVEPKIEEGM